MTQEEKQLLLQDLCTRLPYGVKVTWNDKYPLTVTPHIYCAIVSENNINNLPKLVLRPMSSMTEEEKGELWFLLTEGRTNIELNSNGQLTTRENIELGFNYPFVCPEGSTLYVDWLNAHHFDYRGLIEKGLALEAPKDMYK